MLSITVVLAIGIAVFAIGVILHRREERLHEALPAGWSVGEMLQLLAAVGTLLGAIGALFTTVRVAPLKAERDAAVAARDSAEVHLAAYQTAMRNLVRFDTAVWAKLPEIKMDSPVAHRLDDRLSTGDCDRNGSSNVYDGTGPAMLRCSAGSASMKFSKPTTVLLLPTPIQ